MKKKADSEQIEKLKSCLYYKIFDTIKVNGNKYYLDKEFKLIWDETKEIVGIIDENNINIFFDVIDKLIESMIQDNKNLVE
jgi:hypothetical protein